MAREPTDLEVIALGNAIKVSETSDVNELEKIIQKRNVLAHRVVSIATALELFNKGITDPSQRKRLFRSLFRIETDHYIQLQIHLRALNFIQSHQCLLVEKLQKNISPTHKLLLSSILITQLFNYIYTLYLPYIYVKSMSNP